MYESFAVGYEKLSVPEDYEKFLNYYQEIFEKFNHKPELILDLGCGTGTLTTLMASRGYDMIGIDISVEMLEIAKEKNRNILYLNQDMTSFELYGTVDVIYSSLDCVNYITDKRKLKKMFRLVNNYLNYGGLFIFDINSYYKLKNIIGGNTFVYDTDEVYLVWQNYFKNRLCSFYLDMFYKKGDEYLRFYEEQTERAYEVCELKDMLVESGLEVLGIYDEFSFKKPVKTSERIFFVARRRNK